MLLCSEYLTHLLNIRVLKIMEFTVSTNLNGAFLERKLIDVLQSMLPQFIHKITCTFLERKYYEAC